MKRSGYDASKLTFKALRLANILGMTSPKSKINKVIPMTSMTKRHKLNPSCEGNRSLRIKDDKITIPTFTKLLKMRIVAKSSCGLAKSVKISLALGDGFSLRAALSLGLSEK